MATQPEIQRDSSPWLLLAIVGLGGLLRFFGLGSQPLWYDEAVTWARGGMPVAQLMEVTRFGDSQTPLQYLLTHYVMGFSDREWALRLLPAVFGVLLIPLAYALGRRVAGVRAGRYAAVLVACSPLLVAYSQEARVYSLLALSVAIALLGLVEVMAARVEGRPVGWPAWLAYWGGTTLALYAFNTSVFFWVSAYCVGCAALASGADGRWRRLWHWSLAQLPILGLWTLRVPEMLDQIRSNSAPDWLDASLNSLFAATADLWMGGVWLARPWVALVVAALVLVAIWGWRRQSHWSFLLPGLVVVALALHFGVSQVTTPILASRALIWLVVPLLVVIAAGAASLRPAWLGTAVLAGLLVINVRGLQVHYTQWQNERWDLVAVRIAENYRAGDQIAIHAPYLLKSLRYYLARSAPQLQATAMDLDESTVGTTRIADVAQRLSEGQRLWYVQGRVRPAGRSGPVVDRLKAHGKLLEYHAYRGSGYDLRCDKQCIELFLFAPEDGSAAAL